MDFSLSTIKTSIKRIPALNNIFNANNNSDGYIKKTKSGFSFQLKGNKSFNYELDIDSLDKAVTEAEDNESPSRESLYGIYNGLKDLHVKSQMRTAVFKVISQPWVIVDKDNKPNKELTELFKKKWFNALNEHIINTEFWGHSLIYFLIDQETKEFTDTKLFPREHVNPEKESIIPDLGENDKMISYKDEKVLQDLFIEVKSTETLGLLKDIARYSILKGYAIGDWARSSEKWGDPIAILKSSSQNDAEDEKKESFLKNLGNNSYAIVDKEDEIELLERKSSGNAHMIFKDLIGLNNDETSKGINGQTATSDEKSYVGSSEVQERILNDYTLSRLKELMFFHNETTIPYLIKYNNGDTPYKQLEGYKWMPLAFIDNEEEEKTDPKPNAKKKNDKLKENDLNNTTNPPHGGNEGGLHNPFI